MSNHYRSGRTWRHMPGARHFPVLALLALALNAPQPVHAAGTAYGVDTAEVGDPGNCKVEAWTSLANNKDGLATANPSCVFNTFTPTEISAQVVRGRASDEWSTSLTPKAKFKLVPTSIGSFGFALATGAAIDPRVGETTSVFAYVPATLRLSETVRVNVNGGWLQDRTADRHFATYGLSIDWRFTETLTLTLETFGQAGKADTPSETQPRFQAGVRYRPVDRFSLDVIYGRNINGENADWITVGTTIRFDPK
jgi:hypothetical protein